MILSGRGISKGRGEGEIVLSSAPVSLLGGVNPSTGHLSDPSMSGRSVKGAVFAFPRGKGSTVGSYVLLEMRRQGTLPSAIINSTAEPIVATGAVMAGVPLVDQIDISLLRDGDRAVVDGRTGEVELPDVSVSHVVSCVVIDEGRLLVLKRSEQVGSFRGHWAAVSGFIEEGETPEYCAKKELGEETGLVLEIERSAAPLWVRADDRVWVIHPFLFVASSPTVVIDWEHTEFRWIKREEVSAFLTVPGLDRVLASLGL